MIGLRKKLVSLLARNRDMRMLLGRNLNGWIIIEPEKMNKGKKLLTIIESLKICEPLTDKKFNLRCTAVA